MLGQGSDMSDARRSAVEGWAWSEPLDARSGPLPPHSLTKVGAGELRGIAVEIKR